MYQKILIAVDGSDSNKFAIDDGLELAKALNSKVTAICVFDIGSYAAVAQGYGLGDERDFILNASKAALKYVTERSAEMGVEVQPKIITGRPAEVIIEESKNHDLVVCGTLGRTGLSHSLLGSVAEKIARLAHCPVLICRKQ